MNFNKKQLQAMLFILICMILYTGWYAQNCNKGNCHPGIIRFHVVANSNSSEDQDLKLKVRDGVLESVNENLIKETMNKYDSVDGESSESNMSEQQDSNNINENLEKSTNGEIANETMAVVDSRNTAKVSLDIKESREYLLTHLNDVEEIAEKIIKDNGYDYKVAVELGMRWIPEKSYGDMTFPAGNYEALNITIGEGEGNNWWCVLFPPLCLIDGTDNPNQLEPFETTTFAAIGMTEELLELRKNNQEFVPTQTAIKLKFKTLELLEKQ